MNKTYKSWIDQARESSRNSLIKLGAASWMLVVLGEAVPAARPRVTKHGTYTPERTLAWRVKITELSLNVRLPVDKINAVWLVDIHCAIKTLRRRDPDNITKNVMDGLHPHLLVDDSVKYVAGITFSREFSFPPFTAIRLRILTPHWDTEVPFYTVEHSPLVLENE